MIIKEKLRKVCRMSTQRKFSRLSWVILSLVLLSGTAQAAEAVRVRIGWQIPWATQGQLVQVLKHTPILKDHGMEAEFIGRTYGPMLNELAMGNQVDVILTADQPAATLFSKDKGWIAIGRLMYNRTATYVPVDSPVKKIADLKGKAIALPVGAAAERVTIEAIQKAGLNPQKDVKIINLDIKEQGPLVKKGARDGKWGDFDALAGFDPTPALFEAGGLVRTIDVGKVVSLIVVQESFLKQHPGLGKKLVDALASAYDYYRQHPSQANDWFLAEAGLDGANQKACEIAASLEPNLKAKRAQDIRMTLNDEDFRFLERAAEFIAPKVGKKVDMRKYVTNDYATGKAH